MDVLGKRIVAGIIDYVIVIILLFATFSYVVTPLYKHFSDITHIEQQYDEAVREYYQLRLDFDIDIIEEGKQIINPNLDQSDVDKFNADQRVNEVYQILVRLNAKMTNYVLQIFALCIFITFSLTFLLPMLVLKNGKTIGMLAMSLVVVDKLNCQVRLSQVIVRYLVILASEGAFLCFALIGLFAFDMTMFYLALFFCLLNLFGLAKTTFSPNKESLKDYFTASKIIDGSKELFYESIEAKRQFQNEINDIKEKN